MRCVIAAFIRETIHRTPIEHRKMQNEHDDYF